MDHDTIEVYERRADDWAARRTPRHADRAERFARLAPAAGGAWPTPVVDLGCGPGWYTAALGAPVVALDAARAMVELARSAAPDALPVQADLEALPFRRGGLAGGYANRSYVHVPRSRTPLALADLHRSLAVDAPVELELFAGDDEHGPLPDDDFPGRRFSRWPPSLLADVVAGAGFDAEPVEVLPTPGPVRHLRVRATRARTLADTVGPRMRLLVCGLNPSLYAADAGVGFARPGNRFWPAARAAGLVTRDRDPLHALRHHGIGMTDLVKRATVAADELDADEYAAGLSRVERLCAWLAPRAVCVVGLAGWRAVVDRRAVAGRQVRTLGGAPVHLMPSTSGLNASSRLDELVEHLRAAAALADAGE